MIENFKESPEVFKDYHSELLLKILNKTSLGVPRLPTALVTALNLLNLYQS